MLYRPATTSDRWTHRGHQIGAFGASLAAWLRDWWSARNAISRLDSLDDRLLADLGLERSTISARVRGKY